MEPSGTERPRSTPLTVSYSYFECMSDEFIVSDVSDVKRLGLRYRENLRGAGLEREE